MPSFFRVPGEDTSSSEDSSDNINDVNSDSQEPQKPHSGPPEELSRIQTLSTSGEAEDGDLPLRPLPGYISSTSHRQKDLLIHSMLEDLCLREAADELSKSRNDPDVLALGRKKYRAASKGLSDYANVSSEFHAETHRSKRDTVRQGLQLLSIGKVAQPVSSARTNAYIGGSGNAMALTTTFRNILTGLGGPPGSSSPLEQSALFARIPDPLQSLIHTHHDFNASRYVQDFEQKHLLGKGGYGHVYMAKNRIDGSYYAVKRIPLGSGRLRKIQEGGQKELEALLEEVRTLARLDHRNIVRYHNAWLEVSRISATSSMAQSLRLIAEASTSVKVGVADSVSDGVSVSGMSENANFNVNFDNNDNPSGATVSSTGSRESSSNNIFARPTTNRRRRQSQGTVVTIASSRSKKSIVESVGVDDNEEEDDEEIETIPRNSSLSFEQSTSEFTQGIVSQSNDPSVSQLSSGKFGFALTLNIQMSLHPITLEHFLTSDPPTASPQDLLSPLSHHQLKHCFHAPISLTILLEILKGVSYLHSQNIVHRDLKPANILLSISNNRASVSDSVDISSCAHCKCATSPQQTPVFINPRIGDFGLVAAIEDPDAVNPAPAPKAVGTEFYRPAIMGPVNAKMDVYSLGVILFELLREFPTRMERIITLKALKEGTLPEDFVEKMGERGKDIEALVRGMLEVDEGKRCTCLEIKHWVEEVLQKA